MATRALEFADASGKTPAVCTEEGGVLGAVGGHRTDAQGVQAVQVHPAQELVVLAESADQCLDQ